MFTAMLTVENIVTGTTHDVWAVNVEEEYHEESRTVAGTGATPGPAPGPARSRSRTRLTTGSSPTATMSSAGSAAASRRESLVASHTVIASVSPPSGRSRAVAGSSFITSTSDKQRGGEQPGAEQGQVDVGQHPARGRRRGRGPRRRGSG